jgi:hypothetical protein
MSDKRKTLPTVVKSILSRNKATKTINKINTRDERHLNQKSLIYSTVE